MMLRCARDHVEQYIPIEPRAGGPVDEAFHRDVCTQMQQCGKALVPPLKCRLERTDAMGLFDPGIDVDRCMIVRIGRRPSRIARQTAVVTSMQSCPRNGLPGPQMRVLPCRGARVRAVYSPPVVLLAQCIPRIVDQLFG